MTFSKIVSEEINRFISEKCMLKEYKNPADAETVKVCGDTLQQLHDNIIAQGSSRHEITVVRMQEIIDEIRRLEKMMR
jgi:hypothetical protein